MEMANDFYLDFVSLRDVYEVGDEYDLVYDWALDLNQEKYFTLVNEDTYYEKSDLNKLLDKIEDDPFGVDDDELLYQEQKTKEFKESAAKLGLNMAVIMYMVEALNFFKDKSKEVIKEIAFEIAMQGSMGYDPNKDGYQISKIPNKSFSGYQTSLIT